VIALKNLSVVMQICMQNVNMYYNTATSLESLVGYDCSMYLNALRFHFENIQGVDKIMEALRN
jgi:hypothetical protein